jgi:hypothetical protein
LSRGLSTFAQLVLNRPVRISCPIARFSINVIVQRALFAAVLILCSLHVTACTSGRAAVPNGDLLGLLVNMTGPAAEQRLNQIGKLARTELGRQEIWTLTNDPRFSSVAIGFDKEDRVRYVTAFVDKATATERLAFSTIGDISKAKAEILPPHYRYIWDVKGPNEALSYVVNVYGDDPTYLTIYTLTRSRDTGSRATEDDDDD